MTESQPPPQRQQCRRGNARSDQLGFTALTYVSGLLAPGIVVLGVYGFFEPLFHRNVQVHAARLVVAQFFQGEVLGARVLVGLLIIAGNVEALT